MTPKTQHPGKAREAVGCWKRLMARGPNWILYRDEGLYHVLRCDRCATRRGARKGDGTASYLAENAAAADREFVRAHCSCAGKEPPR